MEPIEDEDGQPQVCDCLTGLMCIVVTDAGAVAAWCIWCGVGFGDYQLLLLVPGQAMTTVVDMEMAIATYPLLGKANV